MNIHWKDWCWSWNSNTLATWWEELTHWKRPWFWGSLKARWELDDRGWDGWMASLNWWTWVCASSGSWWWTGKPGLLQSVGSRGVRHDWATELTEVKLDHSLSNIVDHMLPVLKHFKSTVRLRWHSSILMGIKSSAVAFRILQLWQVLTKMWSTWNSHCWWECKTYSYSWKWFVNFLAV